MPLLPSDEGTYIDEEEADFYASLSESQLREQLTADQNMWGVEVFLAEHELKKRGLHVD